MMKRIVLDLRAYDNREAIHAYLQERLHLPAWYGCNLDALHDCLTDLREDMEIVLHTPEKLEGFALGLRSVFEDACAENPHLHLVEEEV